MKIKICLILYLSTTSFLFSKEMMTHTFKTHNFRIDLPTYWKLSKSLEDHKRKPIVTAVSLEDRIQLDIYVYPRRGKNLTPGFTDILKKLHLWAENYTSIDTEAEFPLYNLEGYWAKTKGFNHKKKIFGYVVYASDGVNIFVIHTYTNANLFPKNFLTMKEILNGFSINRNFKNECCNECALLSLEQSNSSFTNCADFTETEECFTYFQNKPSTIVQCR